MLDTSLELTNFVSIFNDIQMNRFHYILPPNVKKVKSKTQDEMYGSQQERKRQKEVKRIQNEKQVKEWKLRTNENWNNVFRKNLRKVHLYLLGLNRA